MNARNRWQAIEARLVKLEERLADADRAVAALWKRIAAPPPPPTEASEEGAAPTPPREPHAAPATPTPPEPPTPPRPVMEPASAAEPPPPSPPAPPEPRTPPPSLEERFGTQWTVWVGGLALALGGVFLVRYSIEQGLIGPGVRVFLGALLAAALLAAGEWTRRNELNTGLGNLPAAHIPGILTAAGTMVAYATIYAAYALYLFLSPAVAFVLLGLVALATLAAALLHGPALAGLGLVGAY